MFVILIISVPNSVYSQIETIDIEDYISKSNREWSDEEIQEIEELFAYPLPLNSLTFEEYSVFFFLSEFQKKSLFDFVQKNKPLRTVYELQFVLGFTQEIAQLVARMCTLEYTQKTRTAKELIYNGKHTVSAFNSWLGVSDSLYADYMKYPGAALKSSYKYRYQAYNKLYWGVQLKNDMGEPTQKGVFSQQYDFASAYIQLRDYKNIVNLVVGDYQTSIGQGLAMRQGGFYAKSMGFSQTASQSVLKRHSSTNEYLYNRGAGISYAYKTFVFTPFISRKAIDGAPKNDSLIPFQIYKTGLHRTPLELFNKNKLTHTLYGIHAEKQIEKCTFGTAYIHQKISNNIKSWYMKNYSLHYTYVGERMHSYGEIAFDDSFHMAQIHGLKYIFSQYIEGQISARNYNASYTGFMAHAFQEQSNTQNEQGLYMLLRTDITNSISCTIAHDRFQRPVATATAPNMYGNESLFSVKYTKYRSHSFEYKIAHGTKTEVIENQWYAAQKNTNNRIKHTIRFQYEYEKFEFRTAYTKAFAHQKNDFFTGFYAGQDVIYKPNKNIHMYVRYAKFNAPYYTRIYVYEHAVQNAYTMPQVLYAGTQWLFVVKCKVLHSCNVQFQAKRIQYANAHELPEYYAMYGTAQKNQYACIIQYSF